MGLAKTAIRREGHAGGRPRGFDPDRALDTAMRLFWRHGYEGVSINDVTTALGIAPPSLYSAFGSKADLYRAALDRYEEGADFFDVSGFHKAATLATAVDALLRAAVHAVTDRRRERGCMISDGMTGCSTAHSTLAADVARRRRVFRERLAAKLGRWLDSETAATTARYLAVVMQGLSIQARDGASAADLEAILALAMAAVTQLQSPGTGTAQPTHSGML